MIAFKVIVMMMVMIVIMIVIMMMIIILMIVMVAMMMIKRSTVEAMPLFVISLIGQTEEDGASFTKGRL